MRGELYLTCVAVGAASTTAEAIGATTVIAAVETVACEATVAVGRGKRLGA